MPRICATRIRTPQFCQSQTFVTSRPFLSAGDTGAVRQGGVAASDSFNRREQVLENMYFKQHEMENIRKIREKLASQRKQLDEVESHLDEMEKAATQSQQTKL
ncbi:hypothetical protein G647_06381 [Cladophialophora carrionii CBS 160.54]|uniref:ATPase inhibitor, mitochondrial n=1 Tax=Cladophialophora carrionii CBS 160.54 TaxID=1279043 RepID=V9D8K5_9EURO|nr:uncharacterized protein G647_06381 [Cladophialophora carrionii CBS 160.54]ETI22307.1 hypothetical protein G647_06381 [Cladophialophora carrionii CBS 160.54]